MKVFSLVCFCVILNVGAQLLLKKGATEMGQALSGDHLSLVTLLTVFTNLPVVTGFLLWTFGGSLWVLVLARTQLSHAYALYGLTYIFTPVLAVLFFAERMSALRVAGTVLVALGVIVVLVGRMRELGQI